MHGMLYCVFNCSFTGVCLCVILILSYQINFMANPFDKVKRYSRLTVCPCMLEAGPLTIPDYVIFLVQYYRQLCMHTGFGSWKWHACSFLMRSLFLFFWVSFITFYDWGLNISFKWKVLVDEIVDEVSLYGFVNEISDLTRSNHENDIRILQLLTSFCYVVSCILHKKIPDQINLAVPTRSSCNYGCLGMLYAKSHKATK